MAWRQGDSIGFKLFAVHLLVRKESITSVYHWRIPHFGRAG